MGLHHPKTTIVTEAKFVPPFVVLLSWGFILTNGHKIFQLICKKSKGLSIFLMTRPGTPILIGGVDVSFMSNLESVCAGGQKQTKVVTTDRGRT